MFVSYQHVWSKSEIYERIAPRKQILSSKLSIIQPSQSKCTKMLPITQWLTSPAFNNANSTSSPLLILLHDNVFDATWCQWRSYPPSLVRFSLSIQYVSCCTLFGYLTPCNRLTLYNVSNIMWPFDHDWEWPNRSWIPSHPKTATQYN